MMFNKVLCIQKYGQVHFKTFFVLFFVLCNKMKANAVIIKKYIKFANSNKQKSE
jgi:hypothetical protein